MNSNIFEKIVLDDLDHIVFDYTNYCVRRREKDLKFLYPLGDIEFYTFTKKYNLIYQNDTLEQACDFTGTKKQNTDVIERILRSNPDKFFMIINNDRFDTFSLKQHTNCQVWPRKYFSGFYSWTQQGPRDVSVIQKNRRHWFCSVLGRSDHFRSQIFNWIIDRGLEKQNKVSYLCYGIKTRNISLNNDQKDNFIATSGKQEYKNIIPFNNFEVEDEIPIDNDGRIRKPMPLYDCLFNIVVETLGTNGCSFHTEKSLNSILYGHIPILLGGEGTMKKLQDMGIIIPDYIQWSIWDDIPLDSINYNKMDMMQRQLIELFTKHQINDIATDWYPYAVRNFKKFLNLEFECAREEREICRWILTATHNLANPKYQYLWNN